MTQSKTPSAEALSSTQPIGSAVKRENPSMTPVFTRLADNRPSVRTLQQRLKQSNPFPDIHQGPQPRIVSFRPPSEGRMRLSRVEGLLNTIQDVVVELALLSWDTLTETIETLRLYSFDWLQERFPEGLKLSEKLEIFLELPERWQGHAKNPAAAGDALNDMDRSLIKDPQAGVAKTPQQENRSSFPSEKSDLVAPVKHCKETTTQMNLDSIFPTESSHPLYQKGLPVFSEASICAEQTYQQTETLPESAVTPPLNAQEFCKSAIKIPVPAKASIQKAPFLKKHGRLSEEPTAKNLIKPTKNIPKTLPHPPAKENAMSCESFELTQVIEEINVELLKNRNQFLNNSINRLANGYFSTID